MIYLFDKHLFKSLNLYDQINFSSLLIINKAYTINIMKYLFGTSKNVGRSVYIAAAKRTPIGSFNGRLSSFSAPELAGFAIRGALDSINLDAKEVE